MLQNRSSVNFVDFQIKCRLSTHKYTVATNLLLFNYFFISTQQVCYHQADIRVRRIACSGLMITSLLQVVNRLAASCELRAALMQVVSSTCSKSVNIKLRSKSDVHRLDATS